MLKKSKTESKKFVLMWFNFEFLNWLECILKLKRGYECY
jgi:hypothetical protein